MPFKRILCAVDFSRESLTALRVAVELAHLYSGSLCIFHAVETQPVISELVPIKVMGEATIQL